METDQSHFTCPPTDKSLSASTEEQHPADDRKIRSAVLGSTNMKRNRQSWSDLDISFNPDRPRFFRCKVVSSQPTITIPLDMGLGTFAGQKKQSHMATTHWTHV